MSNKVYKINGIEYKLKDKYTLKDWGNILKILSAFDPNNIQNSIIILLTEDKIKDLLSLILNKPIEGEIYEDDFETINRVIQDFFSRKKSLIKNITSHSAT